MFLLSYSSLNVTISWKIWIFFIVVNNWNFLTKYLFNKYFWVFSLFRFYRYFGVVCYAEGTRRHLLQGVSRTWSVYRLLLRHRSLASLQSLSDRWHASAGSDWISSDGSIQQPRHSSRKSSFWCINDLFTLIWLFSLPIRIFFSLIESVLTETFTTETQKICSSKIFFYVLW